MTARFPAARAVCVIVAAACAWTPSAWSQAPATTVVPAPAEPEPAFENSNLDASLFYQLLVGEFELSASEGSTAYLVMLDAANKTKNEQLYKRSVDMALQIRAGGPALIVAQSWRKALPTSRVAHRYLIELLVALNRSSETAEPLRSLIRLTPSAERASLIANLPRLFERTGDRSLLPELLTDALQPYLDAPDTAEASLVAIGRSWQAAGDSARALGFAQRAHARDAGAEGAVLLALELLPTTADAEPIVQNYLKAKPQASAVRMFYARALGMSQRYAEAVMQVDRVTRDDPAPSAPWLTLGALHLELRQPEQATVAIKAFIDRLESAPPVDNPAPPAFATPAADIGGASVVESEDRGMTQAWLMLAQAAEQQGDFKAAEAWLAKVEAPARALEVQVRRASLLARQGRLPEAVEMIRRAPEASDDDARAKLLAEIALLRDARQWAQASETLQRANERFKDDPDLLYEQSMMAEKLDRIDEMERLLRRVIALRPDHQHAHNALGFSLADRGLRLPEAKALIVRALELAPGEPFITDSLGWVEYRLGNLDEAITQLRRAYQSRPDPEIAAHLGEVLWVSGQREEARRILREGKRRDQSNDVLRETVVRLKVNL